MTTSDRTIHLLIRTPGVTSTIACGRQLASCVYYVSSRRYVDCGECLSAGVQVQVSSSSDVEIAERGMGGR